MERVGPVHGFPETAGRAELACPMCGHRFDPATHLACGACPLSGGCALACCPRCGFSSADPGRSRLLQAVRKLRRR
ncbi:MAG TPA: hypothetical protein VG518_08000 [Solirubrobacterales bacterium]|nr:hypothetical protein [Solirubrobacterales bacterium]